MKGKNQACRCVNSDLGLSEVNPAVTGDGPCLPTAQAPEEVVALSKAVTSEPIAALSKAVTSEPIAALRKAVTSEPIAGGSSSA